MRLRSRGFLLMTPAPPQEVLIVGSRLVDEFPEYPDE